MSGENQKGDLMNNNRNENPGCLSGILQLFLLSNIYQWSQEKFGSKRGGCCGCVFGLILFIVFILLVLKIVFNVDWLSFSF